MAERGATMGDGATVGWRWPLRGVAAGLLGYAGHLFTGANPTDEQRAAGAAAVVAALDQGNYHVGVVAGMFVVFCLLVFAAGWRRWASAAAPASLAAGAAGLALVASAGAMILGYGIKGSLAVYLPGGLNENEHPPEGLYALYMFDDLGPFMAWYGVAMVAAAVAWLALGERRLPLWLGAASALFALVPIGFLLVTGLPGFPGVIDPRWLIVAGVGLALSLRGAPRGVVSSASGSAAD